MLSAEVRQCFILIRKGLKVEPVSLAQEFSNLIVFSQCKVRKDLESVGGVLVGLNGRPMSFFSGTCPLLSASLKFRFSRASVCLAGMQALEKISSRFMLADFKFHPAEYQNLDIEVESEQPCLRSCWRLQANVIFKRCCHPAKTANLPHPA